MPTANNWSVISHGGCIIHDIIHINTSKSAVSQSDTHAAYTMDIVDRHVHGMLPSISTYYFHAFYFKRFNSFSLKLISADGMFICMNLVAYGPS